MARSEKERLEILWRIITLIITGIILNIWAHLIIILMIVHAVIVIITGKREKGLADFCELWNSEAYRFARYMTFQTNNRPFPFSPLNRMGKFER